MLPLVQVSAWAHAVALKGTMAVHIQSSPNFAAAGAAGAAAAAVVELAVGGVAANTAVVVVVAAAAAAVQGRVLEDLVLAALHVGLE